METAVEALTPLLDLLDVQVDRLRLLGPSTAPARVEEEVGLAWRIRGEALALAFDLGLLAEEAPEGGREG